MKPIERHCWEHGWTTQLREMIDTYNGGDDPRMEVTWFLACGCIQHATSHHCKECGKPYEYHERATAYSPMNWPVERYLVNERCKLA